MPKRKKDSEDEGSDEDDVEETKPKKAPAKPRAKKAAAATEPFVDESGWNIHPPSLLYRDWGTEPSAKIAVFDLDGTLVNVKSGATFPRTADDWKWYNKKTAGVVKGFHDDGYKVVIISNQGGIKSALTGAMATKVKGRIDQVVEKLGIPVQVYCSTLEDQFRKPEPGMWNFMCENCNGGIKPDLKSSFFVGDAAGRPGDFADSDIKMAQAAGLPFKTPEEVFGEMEGKRAPPPGAAAAVAAASGGESPNEELIDVFKRLADHYFNTDKKFQGAAFRKVATALASFPAKIEQGNLKEVGKLAGVGKGSLATITEYLTTGKVAALEAAEGPSAGPAREEVKTKTNENKSMALQFM